MISRFPYSRIHGFIVTWDRRLTMVSFHAVLIKFCLLFLAALVGFGQETTLRPNLRPGDEFTLQVIRTREDPRRSALNGKARTPVNVRLLEVTPDSMVLEWKFGTTQFDNPNTAKNIVATGAVNVFKGIAFEVILGSDGRYQGLRNEAEVSEQLKALSESLLASLRRQIPNPQTLKALEASAQQMLSTETLLSTATRDIQAYFEIYGTTVKAGPPSEVSIERPNPIGGPEIVPAKMKIAFEKADDNTLSLSATTTYDAAAVKESSIKMMEKLHGELSEEVKAKVPDLTVTDESKYEYDPASGLLRGITIERVLLREDGLKRVDGWEFRLLKGPVR